MSGERELLASCHRRSLEVAEAEGLSTVAFPAISTGVYGFPMEEAARVAITTVMNEIAKRKGKFELIRFVLFGREAFETWAKILEEAERGKNP